MEKLKNFSTFANESIRDQMKPKSDEEIKKSLKSLSPRDKAFKAIKYKMLWLLEEAFEEGIELEEKYSGSRSVGECLVNEVIDKGDVELLKYLVDHGCKIYNKDWSFKVAVSYNFFELAKYLLEQGADIYDECYDDDSHLMNAISLNNYDMVKLLLDNGCDTTLETDWITHMLLSDTDERITQILVEKVPEVKEIMKKKVEEYRKALKIMGKYV